MFCLTCAQYVLGVFYVVFFCCALLGPISLSHYLTSYAWMNGFEILKVVSSFILLVATFTVFGDIVPRTWAFYSPSSLLRFASRISGFFLLLLSPIVLPIARFVKFIAPQSSFSPFSDPKEQILDFVSGIGINFGDSDKQLLQSVLHFKNRIAREIMRPRVGLFCIPDDLSLQQAAELLREEGYSRVPVFHETIDTIVGVLFYKDVLSEYVTATEAGPERDNLLAEPVKKLIKTVFYCPETKKIASLLQEFRKRKTHLAVVVDEYGGTAGLVTIEDILEEIVGEISDEYDEQENLFRPAPDGGWIVDARMNLLDVEEELGVKIPQEEDYDTLAGYIFYRVGSIPQGGLILHHDNFEIEVLKSNDRMVEEVKIKPIFPEQEDESFA